MMVVLTEDKNMTLRELREQIYFQLCESIENVLEVDYDNLKFLPENNIDFSNPETVNRCSSFSLEELKKQRGWAGKAKYLDNCLLKLGSGTARIVYLLEPTKVIKLAKNDKGIAQNEVEAGLMKDSKGMYSNVLAQIIDFDEDYLWVEMEVAKKLDAKTFQNATGMSWKDYSKYIQYYEWDLKKLGNYSDEIPQEVMENEFFSSMVDVAANLKLSLGDFAKPSTYGIVQRDGEPQVVLIDMGLTQSVFNSHYDKRRKNRRF
jgi:hypothetical protein